MKGRKYDSSTLVSTSTAVPALITALVELVVTDLGRLKSSVIGIVLNNNRVKNEDSTLFQGVRCSRKVGIARHIKTFFNLGKG